MRIFLPTAHAIEAIQYSVKTQPEIEEWLTSCGVRFLSNCDLFYINATGYARQGLLEVRHGDWVMRFPWEGETAFYVASDATFRHLYQLKAV